MDTLLGWHAVQFLALLVNPDDASLARTSLAAFEELRESIDRGKPVVLGLIPSPWTLDVTKFTRAHQVVARGYRVDPDGGRVVLVWDPNRPDEAETRLTQAPHDLSWTEAPGGGTWRGFFVESGYVPKVPPSAVDAPGSVAGTSIERRLARLYARRPDLLARRIAEGDLSALEDAAGIRREES